MKDLYTCLEGLVNNIKTQFIMKKIIQISLLCAMSFMAYSQVGVNTNTPHSSAILDLNASDKGVFIPKFNLTVLNSTTTPIANPTNGLVIYNTGTTYPKGIYYWLNNKWEKLHSNGDFDEVFGISINEAGTRLVNSTTVQTLSSSPLRNYIQVANTISGSRPATVDTSTGIITLPKGKYFINVKLDGSFENMWGSTTTPYYVRSNGIDAGGNSNQLYYQNVGVNAVIQSRDNVSITETQYSNQLVATPSGLYSADFNFWLDLPNDNNEIALKLFYDPDSNTLIDASNANTYYMKPQQSGLKIIFNRIK